MKYNDSGKVEQVKVENPVKQPKVISIPRQKKPVLAETVTTKVGEDFNTAMYNMVKIAAAQSSVIEAGLTPVQFKKYNQSKVQGIQNRKNRTLTSR